MSSAKISLIALGSVALGSLFVYAGLTGKSVVNSAAVIVGGGNPKNQQQTTPIMGTDSPEAIASMGLPMAGSTGPVTNAKQAQEYAFSLFSQYGWGTDQEQPLIDLWNKESGWDANAVNAGSQAYGIPQALPSAQGHPFSLGWGDAENQIRWGLSYIAGKYGNPAMAWQHELQDDWY